MEAGGLSFLDRAVYALSNDELLPRLASITALERRLAAARLETVSEIAGRGLAGKRGFASAKMWLHDELKIVEGAAGAMARLAKALNDLPEVAAAMADGLVSEDQALVIVKAIEDIKKYTTPAERTAAALSLIEQASFCTPDVLAGAGRQVLRHVAPQMAEERERKEMLDSERDAWDTRAVTLTNDSSGRVKLKGWLTQEAAAIFRSVMDPLCNPARPRNEQQDDSVRRPDVNSPLGLFTAEPGSAADAADAVGNAFRDQRTPGQRRHDALVEICELLLAADDLPENGGSKPQLTLTMPYDVLDGELKAGTLDTGHQLSAEAVRRLACDAGIIPAVLDGQGIPLDLGRERRLISGVLRRALVLRDRGCAFPGCDRPPRWCQGHHAKHWVDGGETNLANSVLLCGFHHRFVHQDEWQIIFAPDGHPEFVPPKWMDPDQRPRRNHYWRRD
jgi:hypothetical protein